jgi:hypothetical protein
MPLSILRSLTEPSGRLDRTDLCAARMEGRASSYVIRGLQSVIEPGLCRTRPYL